MSEKRTRVSRGTVDAVGEIVYRLLADLRAPVVVKLLTEAGVPLKLIGDGMLVGLERRFQTRLEEATNEAVQAEQAEVGAEVPEGRAANEAGEPRKSAARRN